MVQSAERDIGFLGHVLDLDAFVLVALQQHKSRVDDALTACALIIGQQARRYRFGHVSLVPEGFSTGFITPIRDNVVQDSQRVQPLEEESSCGHENTLVSFVN